MQLPLHPSGKDLAAVRMHRSSLYSACSFQISLESKAFHAAALLTAHDVFIPNVGIWGVLCVEFDVFDFLPHMHAEKRFDPFNHEFLLVALEDSCFPPLHYCGRIPDQVEAEDQETDKDAIV
jgi:hypothetical protein